MDVEVVADINLRWQGPFHAAHLLRQRGHVQPGLQQLFFQLQHEPVRVRIALAAGVLEQVGDADVTGHAQNRVYPVAAAAPLPQACRMVGVQGEGDAATQGAQVELVVIDHRQYLAVGMTPTMGRSLAGDADQPEGGLLAFSREWMSLEAMASTLDPSSSSPMSPQ
ncbi:hypothetical protein D3C81_1371300 [compost metagenome]